MCEVVSLGLRNLSHCHLQFGVLNHVLSKKLNVLPLYLGHLAVFSNKLDAADKVQSIDSDYVSHPFRNLYSEMNVNIHELL